MNEDKISIGDLVRWEWPEFGRFVEGELIDDGMVQWSDDGRSERRVKIRVVKFSGFDEQEEECDPIMPGSVHELGFADSGISCKRIHHQGT
jgi:hypothetical protein